MGAGGLFSLGLAYLSGLSCLHLAEVCARSSVTEFRGPDSEIYFASSKCPGLGSLFTPPPSCGPMVRAADRIQQVAREVT